MFNYFSSYHCMDSENESELTSHYLKMTVNSSMWHIYLEKNINIKSIVFQNYQETLEIRRRKIIANLSRACCIAGL